jgi:hypothetical protein
MGILKYILKTRVFGMLFLMRKERRRGGESYIWGWWTAEST